MWVMYILPDSKVHGANMRPIWGRQDPGGAPCRPHELCYLGCRFDMENMHSLAINPVRQRSYAKINTVQGSIQIQLRICFLDFEWIIQLQFCNEWCFLFTIKYVFGISNYYSKWYAQTDILPDLLKCVSTSTDLQAMFLPNSTHCGLMTP